MALTLHGGGGLACLLGCDIVCYLFFIRPFIRTPVRHFVAIGISRAVAGGQLVVFAFVFHFLLAPISVHRLLMTDD